MRAWFRRVRSRFTGRAAFERELADQIRDHLELRARDLTRAGLSPEEAARRARVEFGGAEGYKELCRARWTPALVAESFARDVRSALRRIAGAPAFALFAVVTLAAGIGVTAAAFSAFYSAVWQPAPVRNPASLYVLASGTGSGSGTPMALRDAETFRTEQTSFGDIAVWAGMAPSLVVGGVPRLAMGEAVTGNYFDLLGTRAALGRLIQSSDDEADAAPVAVLSHYAWLNFAGGDPGIVGRPITLSNSTFTVIGVTARGFNGASYRNFQTTAVWIPLATGRQIRVSFGPAASSAEDWTPSVRLVGRLEAGKAMAAARAEAGTIGRSLDAIWPEPINGHTFPRSWTVVSAFDPPSRFTESAIARVLVMLPLLVLLVACTNLANLVLSRGASRHREFAVRRALGASRWRLVREELAYVGLIAAFGCAAGLVVARGLLVYAMSAIGAVSSNELTLGVDWHVQTPVVVMAVAAGALSVLVAGLAPAWRLTRAEARAGFVSAGSDAAPPRWRGRANLIALQVAASVGLLSVTVVSVRALPSARRAAADLSGVAVAGVPLALQARDEGRGRAFVESSLRSLAKAKGAEAVAVGSNLGLPMSVLPSYSRFADVGVPGARFAKAPGETGGTESARFGTATPDIFRVLGMALAAGRPFTADDTAGSTRVAIVNEGLALDVFGATNVAGRDLSARVLNLATSSAGNAPVQTMTIVGVVPGGDLNRDGTHDSVIYVPFAQYYEPNVLLLARAAGGDGKTLVGPMRLAIHAADPDVAWQFIGRADMFDQPRAVLSLVSQLAGGLAFVSLVLSMLGLSGVLSHVVARRTREIGVRMSLGADAGRIVRMVLAAGLRPVVEGTAIGLVAAAAIRQIMRANLMELSAIDLSAAAITLVPIFAAALVACVLPARRAARVDPNVALKDL